MTIDFYKNKAFIAKELCEKRYEKKSCCKGSCQLRKAVEKSETKSPSQKKDSHSLKTLELGYYIGSNFEFVLVSNLSNLLKNNHFFYQNFYALSFDKGTFRPPCIMA